MTTVSFLVKRTDDGRIEVVFHQVNPAPITSAGGNAHTTLGASMFIADTLEEAMDELQERLSRFFLNVSIEPDELDADWDTGA